MTSFARLLAPARLGPVEVANRIVRSAHGTSLAVDGIGQDFIAYHAARAADGIGLTILEYAAVHPSSPAPRGITAWDDSVIGGYDRLVRALAPHGMKLFQQLHHGGAHGVPRDQAVAWAPSQVPSIVTGAMPMAMTEAQIDEIIAAFAAAARRASAGGLDGVEIQACHGFLPAQFLSPLTNRRDDRYGGSLRRRLTFLSETLAAVRDAVPEDFAVGVRVSASEVAPGGLAEQDMLEVARALEGMGQLDFLNISLGSRYSYPKIIGAMHEPPGYELAAARVVTAGVRTPTIVGGRITSLAMAENILAEGIGDLVSLVRPTIADSHFVRKSLGGRAEQVRPCIACNHGCVAKVTGSMGCTVNPSAGNERRFTDEVPDATAEPLRVVVVGGGPAGLEAARVARLRGHAVVLYERRPALGGQVTIARRAPFRADVGQIVDWLTRELERLGVDVRTGMTASADMVLADSPDAVVVATGSRPRLDGRQTARPLQAPLGGDGEVYSSWDVLEGRWQPDGRPVLLLDDVGHYEGIAVADALRAHAAEVVFVTRHAAVGPLVEASLSAEPARARLEGAGFTLVPRAYLAALSGTAARVRSLASGFESVYEIGSAVLVSHNAPQDGLYAELDGHVPILERVGDALSPRFLQDAIFEGHRAAAGLSRERMIDAGGPRATAAAV